MAKTLGVERWCLDRTPHLIESILLAEDIEKVTPNAALSAAELEFFDELRKEFDTVTEEFFEKNTDSIKQLADPNNFRVVSGRVRFKKSKLAEIHKAAAAVLGVEFAKNIADVVESNIDLFYKQAKKRAAVQIGLKQTVFTQRDTDSINLLKKNRLWFAKTNYSRNLQKKINQTFVDAFDEGIGRNQLEDQLVNAFGDKLALTQNQFSLMASSTLVRARSISQIHQFDEAGITVYTVVAIRDKRTSKICRWLDGRMFSVGEAVKQADSILNARNPEDIEQLHPWLNVDEKRARDGKNSIYLTSSSGKRTFLKDSRFRGDNPHGRKNTLRSNGALQKSFNVGFPPFHTSCRTSVVGEVL